MILITATSYSKESQVDDSQLLYSSKHGRSMILTAKLLLSIVLITGTILLYNAIQWILFFQNPSGWALCIQNVYADSSYLLTLDHLYLVAMLMQWLVGLSLIVTFTFLIVAHPSCTRRDPALVHMATWSIFHRVIILGTDGRRYDSFHAALDPMTVIDGLRPVP